MSGIENRRQKVLSCASCRQRKIKCDKAQPACTNCWRSTLQCLYPSRKPTKRVPRPRQSELLDRISRLENIVGQADPQKLAELDELIGVVRPADRLNDDEVIMDEGGSEASETSGFALPQSNRPTGKDVSLRYMSDEFWDNLCTEVEGIKQALEESSDSESSEDHEQGTPLSGNTTSSMADPSQTFLFANPMYPDRFSPTHPPRDKVLRLWNIYCRKVDPLVKILHRPSIQQNLHVYFGSVFSDTLPPSKSALFFAIHFAAVTSLSQEECLKQFGEKKEVLGDQFRVGVEQALAAADYLNTNDLTTLQATTLYVTVLRCYSLSRASWVLTATVIRLAQAMNLHRDGTGHRFSAFDAEMRRRLWYFITVLDIRAAEDRGTESILQPSSYNTILPTAINDDDFSPESSYPLQPKSRPVDNLISMCMARCSTFGYIAHPQSKAPRGMTTVLTEEELIQHVRRLEADFIHNADITNTNSRYASEVARIVILKLWLIVQYPFTSQPTTSPMRVSRETMLRTAVTVMELSDRMWESPWVECFAWWTETYVQWHPLAVTLAELGIQTEGELIERSWATVERVYPVWRHKVADRAKGPLWRPIRKLYKKAKKARAKAQADATGSFAANAPVQGSSGSAYPPMSSVLPGTTHQDLSTPTTSMAGYTPSYDSINMDPSYLFQYPPELTSVGYTPQMGANMSFDMAPWNEFLLDTQHPIQSPTGSGGSDSSLF